MNGIPFYLSGSPNNAAEAGFPKYSKVKLGYFCLFSTLIPLANHLSLFWEIVQERRIGIVFDVFARISISTPFHRSLGAFAGASMADSANAASVQGEVS